MEFVRQLIDTPMGKVEVTITEANHIHVCNKNSIRHDLTLGGKPISYLSAHFHRHPEGHFDMRREDRDNAFRWAHRPDNSHDTYVVVSMMSLTRPHGDPLPTNNMILKAYEILFQTINNWAVSNAALFRTAESNHLGREIEAKREEIEKAKEKLTELEIELAELNRKQRAIYV